MPNNQTLRGLRLVGAVDGEIRLDTLSGVEHVVAPIVLLVGNTVIHPVNAATPEFVPADTIALAPAGWDGRPAMSGDHPSVDGIMCSANSPRVLEQFSIGQLFGTKFANNRLTGEVWVDPRRSSVPDATEILRRMREGEPVEISVGAFVVADQVRGVHDGREYGAIWREIIPDHVALLREGLVGACSVAMGCGTPRAARRHFVTAAGIHVDDESTLTAATTGAASADGGGTVAEAAEEPKGLAERLKDKLTTALAAFVGSVSTEAMSDEDMRELLAEGLKRLESNFMRVINVTPGKSEVVYLVDPDPGGPMPLRAYMRSFEIGDAGRPTFSEERTPVRPRTEWIPVLAKGNAAATTETASTTAASTATGGCGCGGVNTHAQSATGAEGEAMATHRNAERISALISNTATPWAETDRAYLEGLTDDRLASFETPSTTATTQTAASTTTTDAETVSIPKEELAGLRSIAQRHNSARAAQKTALVGKLKTAQTVHSEADLNAMDVDQLVKVEQLLGLAATPVDFTLNGAAVVETTSTTEADEPPKAWDLALAKRRNADAA